MSSPSGISVIVASYGDKDYWDLIAKRAIASVESQSRPPDQLIRVHGESLSQARNAGVQQSKTEWTCLLDCDDEYDGYYLDCMAFAKGDIRYPRVEYLYEDGSKKRVSYPRGDIRKGNFCVIGSMFRRDLFLKVGGFQNEALYEDWSLWLRMWKAGAIIESSLAVYKVHVRTGSRGDVSQEMKEQWARIIQAY